jgi:translation initiation factor 6
MLATNSYIIVPFEMDEKKIEKLEINLKGEVIRTSIGGSRLIGVLAVANSNGILLPHYTHDDEIEIIKSIVKVDVEKIISKRNALGNLILVNDYGALIDTKLMRERGVAKKIEDVLGVEVVKGEIAGLSYVGSLAVTTNKGVLTHPMLKEKERELLKDVLKVPVEVGTINFGIPFVSSGLIANGNGIAVGNLTTGPETIIISNIFSQKLS